MDYELPKDIEHFCETIEDLEDVGVEIEFMTDWMDLFSDMVEFRSEHDYGIYCLEELENSCRIEMLAQVESSDFDIICSAIDENGTVVRTANISLAAYLKEMINDFIGDYSFNGYLCECIESSLEEYVENSRWHYALRNDSTGAILDTPDIWPIPRNTVDGSSWIVPGQRFSPILWFGPDNMPPLNPWTIDGALSPLFKSEDTWTTIRSVLMDPNDTFLIWYTGEKCCSAPDVSEILKKCPVQFSPKDDSRVVQEKTNQFFANILKTRN